MKKLRGYLAVGLSLAIFVLLPFYSLLTPQVAHADLPVIVTGNVAPNDIVDQLKNAVTSVETTITANSTLATQIKGYVLDPLAHALAQVVLKQITASVVNWINGKNGSGSSLFTQNLGLTLQKVGDANALTFIAQITKQSNSPFAPVIASSLQSNYLQSSSAAGFWAANKCTLNSASPNINSFLAGNFNQGGLVAWFSLTTQPQNNPYTLYYRTQSELQANTATALAQKQTQLNWGQGFDSWCGGSGSGGSGTSGVGQACSDFTNSSDCPGQLVCVATAGGKGTCVIPNAGQSDAVTGTQCVNSDGSTGTVQTPGSVILGESNKVFGSGIDSLVSVHDLNQMADTILTALATQILGPQGLFGASSGGSGSFTNQLQNSNTLNTPGTTGGTLGSSLTTSLNTQLQTYQAQVQQYQSAWADIGNAAQTASTTLQQLLTCETTNSGGDTYGAQVALTTEVAPVVTQANQAAATSTIAQTGITNMGTEIANASTTNAIGQASTDLQTLISMPPSSSDATNAQSQDRAINSATASSTTSLAVSGGTLLDEMNLINSHGNTDLEACQNTIIPQ